MIIILLILLALSAILEGTITTLPLVFISLLLICVLKKSYLVYPLAFFSGLILDIFSLRILGSSVIFFLVFFLLVLLYQRKYEINSRSFVLIGSFVGSLAFLKIFGYANILPLAVLSSVIAVLLFTFFKVTKFSI